MKRFNKNTRRKFIIYLSMFLLFLSITIEVVQAYGSNDNYDINYVYVNVKDMAKAKVATKSSTSTNIISQVINSVTTGEAITEIDLPSVNGEDTDKVEEVELPLLNNTEATQETPKQIWYLPTEYGVVSQYPSYWHVAYDITSTRGMYETIHPVANGVISGIYTDSAGALIVTVLHNIDGQKYTSQYVHLSSYASGLYIGKEVTINDSLGQMGTTGNSTGVHLHITVLDCALFDSSDTNCSDLNGFFRYAKSRYSQNFYGLGNLVYVPGSWTSR